MTIYFVVWMLVIIPYLLMPNRHNTKFSHKYAIYIGMCLTLLIGLRGITVGADTAQYEYRYRIVEEMIKPGVAERGYSFFSYFFKQLGFSYYAYNFVVACILSGVLALYYGTYSKNVAFSTIIFMTIGLLPMYMTGTRQALAISLCTIGFILADKRHSILALAIVLLASTFHTSALACIAAIAFIMLRLRLSRQTIIVCLMIAAAAILYRGRLVSLIQPLIPVKYTAIDLNENYQINPLLIIISILIPMFCVMFDSGVERDGRYSRQRTWLYMFSCANALFTILAPSSVYFSRVAYYFVHANSILIPNMIAEQDKYENRQLMNILIIAVCMAYFVIGTPGGTLQIDQYRFFWQD